MQFGQPNKSLSFPLKSFRSGCCSYFEKSFDHVSSSILRFVTFLSFLDSKICLFILGKKNLAKFSFDVC